MYQRNTNNYDNRRQFVIQHNYFTYQRRGSRVDLQLQIHLLNSIVADLQNQIDNITSNNPLIVTIPM